MNCTRIAQWLPLYASSDLSDAQSVQVRAHLAQCESCATLADEYAAAREWMQGTGAPEFDETFFAELRYGVRQKLAAQSVRAAWWTLRWQPLVVAVALLLLMIFSLRLFQTKGVPPTNIAKRHAPLQQPEAVPTPIPPINELAQTQKPRVPWRKHGRALRIKQEEKDTIVATATEPARVDEVEKVAEPVMSRIEIQTADPNIRIIWLTQNTQRAAAEPLTR
ncbi:MAG: zf-HC2 domain-containing protein [Acidobacteria bacterium]|nr:zf-HC2 domain-containing protein [Acidobacteriota bacterium]